MRGENGRLLLYGGCSHPAVRSPLPQVSSPFEVEVPSMLLKHSRLQHLADSGIIDDNMPYERLGSALNRARLSTTLETRETRSDFGGTDLDLDSPRT